VLDESEARFSFRLEKDNGPAASFTRHQLELGVVEAQLGQAHFGRLGGTKGGQDNLANPPDVGDWECLGQGGGHDRSTRIHRETAPRHAKQSRLGRLNEELRYKGHWPRLSRRTAVIESFHHHSIPPNLPIG
jgi:hypothetical protein